MPQPAASLASWIGRSQTLSDHIGATPVIALNATLDHPCPLIATLLMDLVRRNAPDADVAAFRFKGPCGRHSTLTRSMSTARPSRTGKAIRLWAADHEGWLTMDAIATLREERTLR